MFSSNYPSYVVFVAVFIAMLVTLVLMPLWIRILRYRKIGQQIRADGPERHLTKQGTPTMGGVVILIAIIVTCCILSSWTPQLILAAFATVLTALLGLLDDVESVAHRRSLGLTPSAKLAGQAVIVVLFTLLAVNLLGISPVIGFPSLFSIDLGVWTSTITLGEAQINIPWLYLLFVYLLMAGFSNAVNLNDGLDGLCGGCSAITIAIMGMIAYRVGSLDLSIFAFACTGACIGFLWFNSHPATIFMGDTGSLALGTAFAVLAVLTKTEVISLFVGGIFVIEALSVIIQVVSFKLTGKRVFLMAPLHHHFEKLGWEEEKVVTRFWIIAACLAAFGFALYFTFSKLI